MTAGEVPGGPELASFLGMLRASGFTGEVALHVTDLKGRVLCSYQPDVVFPAASTIKVPLLVMALQEAQASWLDLGGRVTLQAADRVPGAGVLHELQGGLALTWQDVLTLMIVVSDNTATNLVIGQLGLEQVNGWLAARGLHGTRLIGKLQLPPERQNEAQRRGERNRTTARDQTALLGALARGELLDHSHTALALGILERQQIRSLIGRRVPTDGAGEPAYRLGSKSGELNGVHHDVGILHTPRPLVVACLSRGGTDPREHPENRDVLRLADALWPVLRDLGTASGDGGLPGQSPVPGDI